MLRKLIRWLPAILVALVVLIQLVPYGRAHTNPPVKTEPQWNSPETKMLAKRACYDCHSNETHWPWYSNIAPLSWLVQDHVDEGREHLNFSEWDRPQKHAQDAAEEVEEREMPLGNYLWLHPGARLSDAEVQTLAAGFKAMFGEADEK